MKKDRELLQAILRECRRATIILNFGSLAVMFYLLGVDGPILVPAAAWSTGLLLGALAFVAGRRSAGGKGPLSRAQRWFVAALLSLSAVALAAGWIYLGRTISGA